MGGLGHGPILGHAAGERPGQAMGLSDSQLQAWPVQVLWGEGMEEACEVRGGTAFWAEGTACAKPRGSSTMTHGGGGKGWGDLGQ